MRNLLLIASLALATSALAACGQAATPGAAEGPTQAPAPTNPCTPEDFKIAGEFGKQPEITIPRCKPTDALIIKDLVPGTGAEVKAGSTATVNYHLVTFSDKKVLDSSFKRGEPFDVTPVGQAQVIDGWNEGLVGLKENGRRLLVVPPEKGYGQGGNGVKPNETLVFVIDGVKVS